MTACGICNFSIKCMGNSFFIPVEFCVVIWSSHRSCASYKISRYCFHWSSSNPAPQTSNYTVTGFVSWATYVQVQSTHSWKHTRRPATKFLNGSSGVFPAFLFPLLYQNRSLWLSDTDYFGTDSHLAKQVFSQTVQLSFH